MSELTWKQMHEAAVEFQADLQDKLSASQAREAELREKLKTAETENECLAASCKAVTDKLEESQAQELIKSRWYEQAKQRAERAESVEAGLRKLLESKVPEVFIPDVDGLHIRMDYKVGDKSVSIRHIIDLNSLMFATDADHIVKVACGCAYNKLSAASPQPKEPT